VVRSVVPEDVVTIELVGVVGAGTMGAGITEVFARAGLQVVTVDVDRAALASLRDRIRASHARSAASGRSGEPVGDVLARVRPSDTLRAVAECDLVVEAVVESEPAKRDLFRELASCCRSDAVLASNSSSIPIARLSHGIARPGRLLGLHFFNPAPVQPLVEVVAGIATDQRVVERVVQLCEDRLGKHVLRSSDRPGFTVSTLLIPFLLSAIRMVESGSASAAEIDEGMRFACAHSMGPLALSDLMGLDVVKSIADVLYGEYGDAQFAVPDLLERMVDAGRLGRKSGEGFFQYAEAS
jgi:3-hydroxybutyryl-CoA dehydrogenase